MAIIRLLAPYRRARVALITGATNLNLKAINTSCALIPLVPPFARGLLLIPGDKSKWNDCPLACRLLGPLSVFHSIIVWLLIDPYTLSGQLSGQMLESDCA